MVITYSSTQLGDFPMCKFQLILRARILVYFTSATFRGSLDFWIPSRAYSCSDSFQALLSTLKFQGEVVFLHGWESTWAPWPLLTTFGDIFLEKLQCVLDFMWDPWWASFPFPWALYHYYFKLNYTRPTLRHLLF